MHLFLWIYFKWLNIDLVSRDVKFQIVLWAHVWTRVPQTPDLQLADLWLSEGGWKLGRVTGSTSIFLFWSFLLTGSVLLYHVWSPVLFDCCLIYFLAESWLCIHPTFGWWQMIIAITGKRLTALLHMGCFLWPTVNPSDTVDLSLLMHWTSSLKHESSMKKNTAEVLQ